MDELVLHEKRGAIAILTLNRPDAMNALSVDLRRQLCEQINAAAGNEEIRCIVITGAGTKAFTAGLDLKELGSGDANPFGEGSQAKDIDPVTAITACSKPVIGAVNGVAVTGGFELALACDILIASENARFADTHVKVGVMPGWGLSQRLSRLIGLMRAKEISLSARFVEADEAVSIGLVNKVVAADRLLPEAIEMAERIAGNPAQMVQAYLQLIDDGFDLAFGDGLRLEHRRSADSNQQIRSSDIAGRREAVLETNRAGNSKV